MRAHVTLRDALTDPDLLGGILSGDSWLAWRAILLAAMGEKLKPDERAIFKRLTGGREKEPGERVDELTAVIGRRGGKTRSAAVLSVYLATLCDHSKVLALGERGLCLFLAKNEQQAGVAFNYAAAIIDAKPLLAKLVAGRTADTIRLETNVDLEIRAASFRGLRGVTAVAVIADEAAYWFTEGDGFSSNTDVEILDAVRPSLATTGGPLIIIGSPYARRGEMYETHRRDFGPDGDPRILVVHGTSRDFNPSLSQAVVDRAMARKPASARSEYLAEFREGLSAFLDGDWIERAAVLEGELPPVPGISYHAHIDPSGGRNDAFTLGIAHKDAERVIVDVVKGWPAPFTPESVVAEISSVLKRYGLRKARSDRYAGEWVTAAFKEHDVTIEASELTTSELFLECEPQFSQGSISIPRHQRLVNELRNLERRTTRGGRDQVSHPPGLHDDHACAMAGAAQSAASEEDGLAVWIRAGRSDPAPPPVAVKPEPIMPDQLHLTGGSRPGTAEERRMQQRRNSQMVSAAPGEPVVIMSVPRDIFVIEGHGLPVVCVPEGPGILVPLRIARHPGLTRSGARIIDGTEA